MIEGLQSFQNVFKIPELKRRLLITAGLLIAYRLGAHVPTPGIDGHVLAQFFDQMQQGLLGMVDLFSGGNLRRLSIFALGIMPYISASIILQLLTVVIPALERLAKEGEAGRKKITQYTRYGTIVLSAVQALGMRHELGELRRLRTLLAASPDVRAFHEGRSSALPEFYHRRFERMLGSYAELVSREDRRPIHAGAGAGAATVIA